MAKLFFEDFAAGQVFGSGRMPVEADRIKSFAAEFDPQPFHLDDAAARETIFRGLAASGWHTAAMTMRLLVESEFEPAGGIIGGGFDAGPGRCGPATSCASRARCSKRVRRNRARRTGSSRCARRR